MSLRTRAAFDIFKKVFVVAFLVGLVGIFINLPTLITSAWLFNWLFFIFVFSLAFGLLAFGLSLFVDYITEPEKIERLKKFFKKPSFWAFIALVILSILIVKLFFPQYTWVMFRFFILLTLGFSIGVGVASVAYYIEDYMDKKHKEDKT